MEVHPNAVCQHLRNKLGKEVMTMRLNMTNTRVPMTAAFVVTDCLQSRREAMKRTAHSIRSFKKALGVTKT